MYRFFLPRSSFSGSEVCTGSQDLIHHLRDVLRLRPGDVIVFLDNSGWEYETVLVTVAADHIHGEVRQRRLCANEPRTKVTLYQSVLKGERLEWVLQKGTELGVSAFVPILSERCIVQNANEFSSRKTQRWEKILQAAAEQSRRGRIPPLQPIMLFAAACEHVQRSGGLALLPWEGGGVPIRQALQKAGREHPPFSVAVFIGPEGGFSPAEAQLAHDYGLVVVSLGPRILRSETAGITAAALVLYQYGDL